MSAKPSPEQVARALSRAKENEDVLSSKPSWSDYASEGVLRTSPAPDANGVYEAKIDGHDAVVKALKMNEEYYRKQAKYSEARTSGKPRVAMLDSRGRPRYVVEAHAERAEKKGYRLIEGRKPTKRYVNGVWYRRVGKDWVPE